MRRPVRVGCAGLGQYISGVILFEETLFDNTMDGKRRLVDSLVDAGIILGIKVDQVRPAPPRPAPIDVLVICFVPY